MAWREILDISDYCMSVLFLTFYAYDMLPYLLLYKGIWYRVYEVVNRINTWMNTLKSLDFLTNCQGIT